MRRPLGLVGLLYGGGILLGEGLRPPPAFLFAVSLTVAAAALALPRHRSFLLWPLLVLTGWTSLVSHTAIFSPHDLRNLQSDRTSIVTIRGRLCATPTERISIRDEQQMFRTIGNLDVEALRRDADWKPAAGRIVVLTSGLLS